MNMRIKGVCVALLALMLSSCSSQNVWMAEPQVWEEFSIHYETRPEVIREGMNEFLIFANRKGKGKRYIPDLLVHIRTAHSDWRQAIPDGALGVYRRALPVRSIEDDQLFVRFSYHGKKGKLQFDLAPKAVSHP